MSGSALRSLSMVGPAELTTRRTSPSIRRKLTLATPNMCEAVSAMVSSACLLSSGVLAMTRRISAVAVWRSRFIQQPRILDGDDGLCGEVLHELDLLVGERPNFLAVDCDDAEY